MSILERATRRSSRTSRAATGAGRPRRSDLPPAGPDEETVRLARDDFRRRRRAARWRRARPWVGLIVLVALVCTAVWLLFFSSHLTAREVQVRGNGTVNTGAVRRAAEVPMGRPLARVDLAAVRARVEQLPPVRSAAVSRAWPHGVRVTITERQPVAVINHGDGWQAFDAEGVLFRRYPQAPQELPQVRAAPDTEADALAESARVLGALPADLRSRVEYLEVVSIDRITLSLQGGRTVMWGSAAQSEDKATVLAVLLQRPGKRLDVSVPERPTTR